MGSTREILGCPTPPMWFSVSPLSDLWEAPCKYMETSKVQERLLAKLKATDKSVVGKQKETWVATAAHVWQSCWLKEAINKEITQPMSGKITGRTKVRKRCQRGTSQQQKKLELADASSQCDSAADYRDSEDRLRRCPEDKDSICLPQLPASS